MRKHGKGPKVVLVRKYAKWFRGERLRVPMHKRGEDPPKSNKRSKDQFEFGFDPPGSAR